MPKSTSSSALRALSFAMLRPLWHSWITSKERRADLSQAP